MKSASAESPWWRSSPTARMVAVLASIDTGALTLAVLSVVAAVYGAAHAGLLPLQHAQAVSPYLLAFAAATLLLHIGVRAGRWRRGIGQRAEHDLRFRAMFEQASVGLMIVGLDGRWLFVNQRLCDILGYRRAELMQLDVDRISLPTDQMPNRERAQRLARGELDHCREEKRYVRKDGSLIWAELYSTPMRDAGGKPQYFICVLEDISDRKRVAAEVERQALYDALTGLPNRRLLFDRLRRALAVAHRSGSSGAVLFIDLDRFKAINDTYGHAAGDALLKLVAERMQNTLRGGDTVARLAGDEFVILLEQLGTDPKAVATIINSIADALRRSLQRPYQFRGIEYRIGTSIGVTVFPRHADSAEDLLQEADLAMYHAKDHGRGDLCFYAPYMRIGGGP